MPLLLITDKMELCLKSGVIDIEDHFSFSTVHRVILRAPYVAREFLRRNQYKQMIGRAGRAGIDTVGESILVLQEKDKQQVTFHLTRLMLLPCLFLS